MCDNLNKKKQSKRYERKKGKKSVKGYVQCQG